MASILKDKVEVNTVKTFRWKTSDCTETWSHQSRSRQSNNRTS